MKVNIQKIGKSNLSADAYLFLSYEDKDYLEAKLKSVEKFLNKKIVSLSLEDFTGSENQVELIYADDARIILMGLGKKTSSNLEKIRKACARGIKKANEYKVSKVAIEVFENDELNASLEDIVRAETIASILALYTFDKYFSIKKEDSNKVKIKELTFFSLKELSNEKVKTIENGVKSGQVIAEATKLARDLGNEPSNIIYPKTVAEFVKELSKKRNFSTEVLNLKELKQKGMGGILGVSQGSVHEPKLVVMKYFGAKKNQAPYVIVGKGVTFDSGGISIKPSAGMGLMKMDMGGAAAVIGIFDAISQLKLNANVIGIIPLVENMPSGTAYKPGDVLKSYKGLTIEVDNTDAEGRIILADALAYASEFDPKLVIDMATLTGAALIALGSVATIAMGNDSELIRKIQEAGDQTYERVWELPLWEEFEKMIDSDIADVKNTGPSKQAGTIMGGVFLKKFVGDYPWVHLDIAATAISSASSEYIPKNATGVGVRLITQFLMNECCNN